MENIASHLKLAESKQRNLCKAHEQLHAEASSFLIFSLRWKDLEQQFDSTRELIQKQYEELQKRHEAIALKERELDNVEKSTDEYYKLLELNKEELSKLNILIGKYDCEAILKEKELDSAKQKLKTLSDDIEQKERQKSIFCMKIMELESIQNVIATKSSSKERELELIEKSIKLRTEELGLKEGEFISMQSKLKDLSDDLSFKESEVESIKRCIEEHSKELDMQERQLDSTQRSIRDCQDEVVLLKEYVSSMEKAINECSKELGLKESHLDSLQMSEGGHSKELASVEKHHNPISVTVNKCLEGLKAQKKCFHSLRKSIEERSLKLKNEENDFKKRNEELNKMDAKVSKGLNEIELEKMDIDSQFELLEKNREELRLREEQFKLQAEKIESKEKDIDSFRALKECFFEKAIVKDNSNVPHLKVEAEESNCRPDWSNMLNFHSGMTIDGKLLLPLLCEHLKVHDLVCSELAISLQNSHHSAKLVLDAMRWFYPPYIVTEDTKFDVHNMKRACILLSELMLKASPKITPQLKEEALKLASPWKDKIREANENHLEVVAFLLLVSNFELAPQFNADELCILLNSVSHYKQAVELGRALGIADKSPVGSTGHCLVKVEQSQSLDNKAPVSSLENEQFSANPSERKLYFLLYEQLNGLELMPDAIMSTLGKSLDPAKLVLDVIRGSFHQQLKKGQIGFEASSLSWCPLLLKELMKISPQIDLRMREDAMKLAIEWKSNISSDGNNSLETIGFLQLLVSYGLTNSFSGDEILKLFENIVLHEQASELCEMFGLTQKIHDVVQNLIGTKQFVQAVRFICGYKMVSFRPVQILNEFLQDATKATMKAYRKKNTAQEKDELIDKEIDALKSVITCIADCNLHSEISPQPLENHIASLEKLKTNKRTCEPKNEPHHLDRRNPSNVEVVRPNSTMAEAQEQQQGRNKRKIDQMNCPRMRSSGFSNSSPSKDDMSKVRL